MFTNQIKLLFTYFRFQFHLGFLKHYYQSRLAMLHYRPHLLISFHLLGSEEGDSKVPRMAIVDPRLFSTFLSKTLLV